MLSKRAVQAGGVPALYAVTPPTGAPGPISVMLIGANFGSSASVSVSGTLVAVSAVVVVNASLITATFTIDPAAALTARNVTVTTNGVTAGPATFTVTAAPGIVAGPRLWLEADYGIVDAPNALLTAWGDRSGNAANTSTGSGMTAPTYRSTGFGGSALPYIDFEGSHGILTPTMTPLSLGSFTVFSVGLRAVADGNGNFYEHFIPAGIGAGLRNTATSIYAARMPSITLLQSARNTVGAGAIPTNVRKIFRHVMDGTNTGHQLYMNGVLTTFGTNPDTADPGTVASGDGSIHIGYRDSGTPSLNLTGQIAATLVYSPMLGSTDTATVETYLAKWLTGGATAGSGPIVLNSSVIRGVTITVYGTVANDWTAIYQSSGIFASLIVVTFSTPIIQFGATQSYAPYPSDTSKATVMFAGGSPDPVSGLPTPGVATAAFANTNGDREFVTYLPGFTTVVMGTLGRRPDSGYNIAQFQNFRFWLPGDPLYS
jgi:hypothetical protein